MRLLMGSLLIVVSIIPAIVHASGTTFREIFDFSWQYALSPARADKTDRMAMADPIIDQDRAVEREQTRDRDEKGGSDVAQSSVAGRHRDAADRTDLAAGSAGREGLRRARRRGRRDRSAAVLLRSAHLAGKQVQAARGEPCRRARCCAIHAGNGRSCSACTIRSIRSPRSQRRRASCANCSSNSAISVLPPPPITPGRAGSMTGSPSAARCPTRRATT